MEVNRLLGDEVVYELTIRGLPIRRTVVENRNTLRGALRAEREGTAPIPEPSIELVLERELAICNRKLVDLHDDVSNFDVQNRENEFRRISSRLHHVNLRLSRLPAGNAAEEEQITSLIGRCRQLMDSVGTLYHNYTLMDLPPFDQVPATERSILDEPNPMIPEVVHRTEMFTPREEENISRRAPEVCPPEELIDFDQPACEPQRPSPRRSGECSRSEVRFSDTQHTNRLPTPRRERNTPQVPPPVWEEAEDVIDFRRRVDDPQVPFPERFTEPSRVGNRFSSSMRENLTNQGRNPYPHPPRSGRTATMNTTQDFEERLRDLRLSPIRYTDSYPTEEYRRYVDVSRWNLRYNGETSVATFLERLEEMRQSRGVSYDRLLRSAPELFTGQALLWFRMHNFMTWDSLVTKLKEDFQPYDYVNALWEEIRKRTQGARERVVVYVAAMENLFNKLGTEKPPEVTRVNQIRRNLLPYIQSQLALTTVNNIADLVRLGKAVEETALRSQEFNPPPANYKYLLEPELAYHKPSGNVGPYVTVVGDRAQGSSQNRREGRAPPIEQNPAVLEAQPVASSSASTGVVCWNCKKTGHRFRKCSESRRVFCFKCGRDSVYTNACPTCRKNPTGGQ